MSRATKLYTVSITGADDRVPVSALADLAQEYPFVEWALLYLPGGEGRPRNPTRAWREAFFDAGMLAQSAVHLCGEKAMHELLKGQLPADVLRADRLQLNVNSRGQVFTQAQVLEIFQAALAQGPHVILQYHEGTAEAVHKLLATLTCEDRMRVGVLLDGSKGRGIVPERWEVPAELGCTYLGFAGGLGPENITQVAKEVAVFGRDHWLDMESGVRTDNQFDLDKCRQVLANSEPFICI